MVALMMSVDDVYRVTTSKHACSLLANREVVEQVGPQLTSSGEMALGVRAGVE